MKTIQVSNGDIKLSNGNVQFLTGQNKLVQDLALWLKEPFGTGYTTPGFGSTLTSLIGGPQNSGIISTIQNEILRVLQLYQGQQVLELQTAQNAAKLSYWNKSEIIQSIDSVSVTLQNTAIIANISLTTLINSSVNLNVFINSNGVSVNNG
jgi:phage baseplate assembly protein W